MYFISWVSELSNNNIATSRYTHYCTSLFSGTIVLVAIILGSFHLLLIQSIARTAMIAKAEAMELMRKMEVILAARWFE